MNKPSNNSNKTSLKLGEILIKKGVLTEAVLKKLLKRQKTIRAAGKNISLGKLIIEAKIASKEQLQECLQQQAGLKEIAGYKIINKIGAGGMGTVYRALQISMNREVALKILPPKQAQNSTFIKRFHREARTAARLNHPNIVTAIDVGESKGLHFFAMEYVHGLTLKDLMEQKGGALDENYCIYVVKQVVIGLQHATKEGIIHRDIKPDNILLTSPIRLTDNEAPELGKLSDIVKIADMGLAKFNDENQTFITQAGSTLGTPHYISPEQALGEEDLDFRCDMYSLGATFFHIITGKTPFGGNTVGQIVTAHVNIPVDNPRKHNENISNNCANVIMRMMQKKKSNRYASNEDLLKDLDKLLEGKNIKAKIRPANEDTLIEMSTNQARNNSSQKTKLLLIGTIVFVLAILAFILNKFLFTSQDDSPTEVNQPIKNNPKDKPVNKNDIKAVELPLPQFNLNDEFIKSKDNYEKEFGNQTHKFSEKINFWERRHQDFSNLKTKEVEKRRSIVSQIEKIIFLLTKERDDLVSKTISTFKKSLTTCGAERKWSKGCDLINNWESSYKKYNFNEKTTAKLNIEKIKISEIFFTSLLTAIKNDFNTLWKTNNRAIIEQWENTKLPALQKSNTSDTFNINDAIKRRLTLYEIHKKNLVETQHIRELAQFFKKYWDLTDEQSKQASDLSNAIKLPYYTNKSLSFISHIVKWIEIQQNADEYLNELTTLLKKMSENKKALRIDNKNRYSYDIINGNIQFSKEKEDYIKIVDMDIDIIRTIAKESANSILNTLKKRKHFIIAYHRYNDLYSNADYRGDKKLKAQFTWFGKRKTNTEPRIPCILDDSLTYTWAINFNTLDKISNYFLDQNALTPSGSLSAAANEHGLVLNEHILTFRKTPLATKDWTVEGLSWPSEQEDSFHITLDDGEKTLFFAISQHDLSVKKSFDNQGTPVIVGKQENKFPALIAKRPVHWKITHDRETKQISLFIHGRLIRTVSNINNTALKKELSISFSSVSWAHELLLIRGHQQ